jgi:hypothetical protein
LRMLSEKAPAHSFGKSVRMSKEVMRVARFSAA